MRTPIRYAAASAAAVIIASTGLAGLAGPAHAAQSTQTLSCGGQEMTVRVNVNKSPNGGWSAAQIVAGGTGHLVPTEFTGSLYDESLGQTLFTFDQVKAGGNANHNQPTVTCTHSESGKLGASLGSGETLPPGISAEDDVTFTLTVTAIQLS
jgi:hypothetical protein